MYKFIIATFLFCMLFVGSFLDQTSEAEKSDVIVALGGGWHDRIDKAISLYQQGYSNQKRLIYTHKREFNSKTISFDKQTRMNERGIEDKNILHWPKTKNTYEELVKLKEYLIANNYKSAIIVSHPAHSRRIRLFAKYLLNYEKSGLSITIVKSSNREWDSTFYFLNPNALKMSMSELLKIPYNFIKYGLVKG